MQSRTSSLIHRVHVSRLRLVVFPTTSAPFIVRFFGDLLIRFLRHRTSSRRRSDRSWPRAIPICAPLEVDHVASSHARESVRRIEPFCLPARLMRREREQGLGTPQRFVDIPLPLVPRL